MPTLVDGELVLTESRAIMQYLASKAPDAGLLPRDERARADVIRWQFWDCSHFSPQLGMFFFEKIVKSMMGMGPPDSRRLDEALANFRRYGAALDLRLHGKQFVVGAALTLADLTLASSLMYAKQTGVPLSEFPSIEAWFSRISEIDAWKKTAP